MFLGVKVRVSLLGCGSVGYAIAYAFAEDKVQNVEFNIYDASIENLKHCTSLPLNAVYAEKVNLAAEDVLRKIMRNSDLVIEALPGSLGFKVMKIASESCVNTVSVSYTPENPLILNEKFRRCRSILIPDAGFAPGISNILVGHALTLLNALDDVRIYVGGLPEKPIGPLKYVITWSVEDLIDEYLRKARIIKEYNIIHLDPLESIETIEIPGFGTFEAFYTDGLRTLLYSMAGKIRNAFEKTLRYPGHIEGMKLLRDLGLMDEEPLDIDGVRVIPRKFLSRILKKKLSIPNVKDIAILFLIIVGSKDDEKIKLQYLVWSKFDTVRGLSAMSKITGFTTYSIARLIIDYPQEFNHGVIPPEYLGTNETVFKYIINKLSEKGIKFEEFRSKS